MKKLIAPLLTIAVITVLLIGCAKETIEPGSIDDRDKFIGSWLCKETSATSGSSTFTITVSKSASVSDELLISNFYNMGNKNTAVVKVSKSNLTIPSQVYSGLTLSGQGASTGASSFSMSYAIGNNNKVDNVSAQCVKQ